MTRTTDPEPEPFRPFREKVTQPAPAGAPEWRPRPGSPGIYENAEGKVRTDQPPPQRFPTRVP